MPIAFGGYLTYQNGGTDTRMPDVLLGEGIASAAKQSPNLE
jgi:hypothetical protein